METNLARFIEAQESKYATALKEIRNGKKESHWMWYIFPQLAILGRSDTAKFYGIRDLAEATAYLRHPVLGGRLVEISQALLKLASSDAYQVFGSPDHMKLQSSMTLFAAVPEADKVFLEVIQKFYDGVQDEQTLAAL